MFMSVQIIISRCWVAFLFVFFFFFFLSQTCPFSFLLQLCFFRVSVLLSASLMCNFSPGVSVRLSGWLSLRMSTYCGVHSFSGGRVVGLLSHAKRKKKYYTYTCCIYVPANSVGDTYTHTLVFCTVQQTARTVRVSGGRQRCDVPKRTWQGSCVNLLRDLLLSETVIISFVNKINIQEERLCVLCVIIALR